MQKISVLTPSFNSGKYLERAILSVIKQDYRNFEHIVVDGGSTDNTIEILKKFPHLTWISEKDKGQSDAMNKAFAMSTGDIIVYLNADDYFDNGIFELVIDEFEKDSTVDMIVGNGTEVDPQGIGRPWNSETNYEKCLQFYKYQFPLNPVSYFYKRHVQEKISYNVENHYNMDYEFLLRVLQHFKTKKIERNFGFFMQDGDNKSSNVNGYALCKKTVLKHCLQYDKARLLVYVPYFIRRKIFRLPQKKLTT